MWAHVLCDIQWSPVFPNLKLWTTHAGLYASTCCGWISFSSVFLLLSLSGQKPRPSSPQLPPPAPPGEHQSVSGLHGKCNPFSACWVCLRVSSQLDEPKKASPWRRRGSILIMPWPPQLAPINMNVWAPHLYLWCWAWPPSRGDSFQTSVWLILLFRSLPTTPRHRWGSEGRLTSKLTLWTHLSSSILLMLVAGVSMVKVPSWMASYHREVSLWTSVNINPLRLSFTMTSNLDMRQAT